MESEGMERRPVIIQTRVIGNGVSFSGGNIIQGNMINNYGYRR